MKIERPACSPRENGRSASIASIITSLLFLTAVPATVCGQPSSNMPKPHGDSADAPLRNQKIVAPLESGHIALRPEAVTEQASPISASQNSSLPSNESAMSDQSSPQKSEPSERTFGDQLKLYRRSLYFPENLLGPVLAAGWDQWLRIPPAWNGGSEGFSRRLGSSLAQHAISATVSFGFAAVDGEDPRYFPSDKSGWWARTKYAMRSTFVSRTAGGGEMPAFSRLVGDYGSAFIADQWYPNHDRNALYAFRMGSTSLAGQVGFQIANEFWPVVKHALHIH